MSDTVLSVNNITKTFPGVVALDNISLVVKRGHVHGIVGENGAGKSTLMKIFAGVHQPDKGYFVFDGNRVDKIRPVESLRMGLSIIYQEFNLVNNMSAGENIFLGRYREVGGMKEIHRRARSILDSIGCAIDTHSLVEDLSVSQKQMIEIAKALSFDSKLLIMDEPSSSLTADEMKTLMQTIKDLRERGITILYISHKLDEIFELCDMVTIMRDGNIIDTKPISKLTRSEMIAKMIGRSIDQEYPDRVSNVGDVVMKVEGLNTLKLKDISFELRRGEILGFVGLVGSGRSEIVRALFGADKVSGHRLTINGELVHIKSPEHGIKAGIGYIPEDRRSDGLLLNSSVEQNLALGNFDSMKKNLLVSHQLIKKMADKQIKDLDIKTPSRMTQVGTLSGGNQQKVVVGRWLEKQSQILIMDEPTRGIDVGAKYEIYMIMKQIAKNGGSVILISSELPEVLSMSNRVLTIRDGSITGEFNPEVLTAQQIMDRAI